jgi:hypothetical protein
MALSNRIILIQDFWRLFSTFPSSSPHGSTPPPVTLRQIAKQVDFYTERPLLEVEGYLAYDRGKVAIAGIHGIYVLVLDSVLDQLGEIELPPKDVSLQSLERITSEHTPSWQNLRLREVRFDYPDITEAGRVLCLQVTATKLYVSALSGDWVNERGENMWCYDFARSPSPR